MVSRQEKAGVSFTTTVNKPPMQKIDLGSDQMVVLMESRRNLQLFLPYFSIRREKIATSATGTPKTGADIHCDQIHIDAQSDTHNT